MGSPKQRVHLTVKAVQRTENSKTICGRLLTPGMSYVDVDEWKTTPESERCGQCTAAERYEKRHG
jgi:hypothetical protein